MNGSDEKGMMTVDLIELLRGLWARKVIIIVITIACALIGMVYASFFITPTYQATAKMYVDNLGDKSQSSYISTTEISAAKSLVSTYAVIAKTRDTLDAVNNYACSDFSYSQLSDMISISSVNDTEVFQITVTCEDANIAKIVANALTEVLPGRISDAMKGAGVTTIEKAYTTGAKVAPSISKYTILFGMLGLVATCGVIIVIDLLDDKIHGEEYINNNFKHPVIAVIPDLFVKSAGGSKYNAK